MWLGSRASSQAALPAFALGLAMSSFYVSHRAEQNRMRVVSFAFLMTAPVPPAPAREG
jgi:hypothetical protein